MPNPYETPSAPIPNEHHPQVFSAPRQRKIAIALATGLLVPVLYLASFVGNNPTWWKPFPMAVIIPVFILRSRFLAFSLIATFVIITFTAITLPMAKRTENQPGWSLLGYGFVYALNFIYLLVSFPRGVKYDGIGNTLAVWGITFALLATVVVLTIVSRNRKDFAWTLATHWVCWVWLILYAFPLFGPLFTLI